MESSKKYAKTKIKLQKQQALRKEASGDLKKKISDKSKILLEMMRENKVKVCPIQVDMVTSNGDTARPQRSTVTKYLMLKEGQQGRPKKPCPSNIKKALSKVVPPAKAFDAKDLDDFISSFIKDFVNHLQCILQPSVTEPKVVVVDKLPAKTKPSEAELKRGKAVLKERPEFRDLTEGLVEKVTKLKEVDDVFKPEMKQLQESIKELTPVVLEEIPIPENTTTASKTLAFKAPEGKPAPMFEIVASKKTKKVELSYEEIQQIVSTALDAYLRNHIHNGIVEFDHHQFIREVMEELQRRCVEITDDKVLNMKPIKRPCDDCGGTGMEKRSRTLEDAAADAGVGDSTTLGHTMPHRRKRSQRDPAQGNDDEVMGEEGNEVEAEAEDEEEEEGHGGDSDDGGNGDEFEIDPAVLADIPDNDD